MIKKITIAAAVVLVVPFFAFTASSAPVFLKNPKAVPMFSEVKITDAEADQAVGYTLVCDRSIFPSPSGALLTFRVDPHTHYNCQLTAKNSLGNTVSVPMSFDSSEWFEVGSAQATSTLGLSLQFGTLTFTNNSAKTITLTGLPVKLSWSLLSSSVDIGANATIVAKNSAGFTYGRSVVTLGTAQNTVTFTLGLGNTVLASGQTTQVLLSMEDLRATPANGEWVKLESASSTSPVETTPQGLVETGSFSLQRSTGIALTPSPSTVPQKTVLSRYPEESGMP